jgi:hypothetical protein
MLIKKFLRNEKGNAIIISMFLVVAIGAIAVISINTNKVNTKNQTILDADKDLQEAVSRIATLLVSPSHCNANFVGRPFSASPTAIYRCTANCSGSSSPRVVAMNVFSEASPDWNPVNTGLTDRVRIVGFSYTTTMQTTGPSKTAGVVTATIRLQKNNGINASNASGRNTSVQTRQFNAYVVTSTWTDAPLWTKTDAANILGCSRAASSTAIY